MTNIDKKCAEYGFKVCDYPRRIYDMLNEELAKLREKGSTNVLNDAKAIQKNVTDSLPDEVKNFNEYVEIRVLKRIISDAERIQKSERSDEEKIEEFTKERKFSSFANECENSLRKVLGILSTEGVFASIIWIESKEDEESYRAVKYQISKFLHEIFRNSRFSGSPDNLREEILNICDDISQMFFVKQILEQILTYALYRARSLG
ncbi:MAG: hypothetical protein DRP09_19700 [Candidatus Thorarchaeota archaeon]|nr:MAG: hypothetical protein DRP09_19700 [Candidatus Thorarchaeota archaeon]